MDKKYEKIIENHKHWIKKDVTGWESMRADLRGAQLQLAELQGAQLQGARLQGAWLQGADLRGARLQGAWLQGAQLQGARLQGAQLQLAELQGADLRGARLQGARLQGAHLQGAQLQLAELQGAQLQGAQLQGAENVPFIPMTCPESGSFTAWKKAKDGLIVKLLIPHDAKRSSSTGRKCRCDKAFVLAIENIDGTEYEKTEAVSIHDSNFIYKKHSIVRVDDFCDDRWQECASGIHFFMCRQEAVDYN